MSGDTFRIPSSIIGFTDEPSPNPNLQQQLIPPPAAPPKKKRNLPGNPDPDAEVIALSPKTLMTTNRFVCEICNKGFQRDQNLQLHRRGHNLPWKLRQRPLGGAPTRKRVYVCPETTCVHHDPSRALGDLTGIKKHFSRKHGEKKWKCERCGKRYAVNSDYKAHSKTCGNREYRCDCGTIFSRRDSFVTHRAFCDALTQDTAGASGTAGTAGAAESMSYVSDDNQAVPPPAAAQKSDFSLWLNRSEMEMGNHNSSSPVMSATALLQKAAQMGAKTSGPSSSAFFSGLLRSMKGGSSEFAGGGGLTRDFMGLGAEDGGRNIQDLTMFASLGSGMDFMSTSAYTSYNAGG